MKKSILLSLLLFILLLSSCGETIEQENKEQSLTNFSLLVNKEHPLIKDYIPDNLVPIKYVDYIIREDETMMLNKEVLNAYNLLYKASLEEGLRLTIFSAYRSFDKQNKLFEHSQNNSLVAKPGESEHQTGLAIDISRRDIGLTTNFQNTKEYTFLINNAHKYGFISRYPKDKEKITGYSFEPWHFRYVGVELALHLKENNLTLEEYFA